MRKARGVGIRNLLVKEALIGICSRGLEVELGLGILRLVVFLICREFNYVLLLDACLHTFLG